MSTATAEPAAKTTEDVLPPIGDAPTPKQKEAFLDIFRKEKGKPKDTVVQTKVETEQVKVEPAPGAKTEPVKEPSKTDPVKTEVAKEEKPKEEEVQDRDFAGLRKKAEAKEKEAADAIAERDRIKAEMEELRKKPAPEEFIKEFEKTKAERLEYQKRLREADLARDPEFNAQFDNPIRAAMQRMVDIAVSAGVPKDEAVKTVTTWNKGTMAEWLDGTLGPVEKMEFGAEMQQAMSLYTQKETLLAQADETYQKLVKQRGEEEKAKREQYLGSVSAAIEENLKELAETPLGKDHVELLAETKTLLRRAGGLEGERIDNKTLLGMVGKSLLLAKGFEKQQKALEEKDAKIAEITKTLEERDKFIKELNGATPGIGGTLPAKTPDAKAAARAILNPVIA